MRGSRQQQWCRLRVAPTGIELLVTELRGRATQVQFRLIVLGFNDMSTLVGHFVSSPREREKRDSKGDERER